MAERRNEGRVGSGSRLRTERVSDYEARLRELTEAFTLPPDMREWVTVRYDPDADDETLRFRVTINGMAGRSVASLDVDGTDALSKTLEKLLDDHRDDLQARLKTDLATNLLAAMTAVPVREEG